MNTTLTQHKSVSLPWLAAWVIASAIGLVVGFLATLPLIWSVGESANGLMPEVVWQILGGVFFGGGLGLALGFAQWLVLRQRGQANLRWLGATVIGGVIGGVVGTLFSVYFNDGGTNAALTIVTFGLLGGILGAVQFAMVRDVAKNVLWVVASAVALAIAAGIPFGAVNLEIVGVSVGGLLYGLVTAAALWWFARQ